MTEQHYFTPREAWNWQKFALEKWPIADDVIIKQLSGFLAGPPDARYIRVETCMFMVKLPQYSSQEIMTERLLYAINCREDPLTDR